MDKMYNIAVDKKYYPALGNFFAPNVIGKLGENKHSPYLEEVCINSGLSKAIDFSTTVGDFFDLIYNFLFNNYRNEYVYKNVIANRILAGRHSLTSSQMLPEFRIGNSKADIVLLNGTSTVYEIKSEYDSFARLEKQVNSYSKAFDHINVITSPSQANGVMSLLSKQIGVLVLNKSKISVLRESKSNKKNIEQEILFESLRKDEYSQVIRDYYGTIPEVPNTVFYKECKKLFCDISSMEAHDLSVKALKHRSNSKLLKTYFEKAPHSTFAYALSVGNDERQLLKLINIFNDKLYNYFKLGLT
jgi:hypothetical protein